MNKTARIGLVPVLLFVLIGVGCATSSGGVADCLDERDIETIRAEYLANPAATEQQYVGNEYCVEGSVEFVQHRLGSVSVAANIAIEVGVLLLHYESREPEKYRELAAWAEGKKEGDPVRLVCTFGAFINVEDAPEPFVVITFDDCGLPK